MHPDGCAPASFEHAPSLMQLVGQSRAQAAPLVEAGHESAPWISSRCRIGTKHPASPRSALGENATSNPSRVSLPHA
jgi:hypothetical protein